GAPKKSDRPSGLLLRGERKRGDLDVVYLAVSTVDVEGSMDRSALAQRDHQRGILDRNPLSRAVEGSKPRSPFLGVHPAGLLVGDSQQCLGGLVVEQQRSAVVGEERGGRDVGEQVSRQEHL